MTLVFPRIVAPDSSHWAKWLDATRSPDPDRRRRAQGLHARMVERGRVPLLSWHHLEELLGVEDDATARARIATLQRMPLLAWLRLPHETTGIGSVVQVLAAEAIAACEGCGDLVSIRDRARSLLLQMANGAQAIGREAWVWEIVRRALRSGKGRSDMVAAFGPLKVFDEDQTIGELAKGSLASSEQVTANLESIRAIAFQEALRTTDEKERARGMADAFVDGVRAIAPRPGMTVREVLVATLVARGLDEEEVRDECVLADLNRLAVFRSQLRVVAPETGHSFEQLKAVPMDALPSRVVDHALRVHGQSRDQRHGSDVNDLHLAVLAAYCDVLYVDKRTAEDFRRARRKETRLDALIGEVAKGSDFEALLGP